MRGLQDADHPCASLWLVRGIRGVIVTVAMGAFAGGLLYNYNQGWLLIFGAIFLGEELYETGVDPSRPPCRSGRCLRTARETPQGQRRSRDYQTGDPAEV